MKQLAINFYEALEKHTLPPFEDVNLPNLERKQLVANLLQMKFLLRYQIRGNGRDWEVS